MNDNATKWVEALRSGEFEQGTKQLRSGDNSYCCLGVACELYRRETGQGHWAFEDDQWNYHLAGGMWSKYLPTLVKDWLGVENSSGRFREAGSLSWLNDRGHSFAHIAGIIESNPEGLFHE